MMKHEQEKEGSLMIHCLTNYITANDVANVIASLGNSPIMAHHEKEVEEITKKADCLLLNLGATEYYAQMEQSAEIARNNGIPIVLDPVGVGASTFRREFAKDLIAKGGISCIRGNISEIKALVKSEETCKGLDADREDYLSEENLEETLGSFEAYARNHRTIVFASGKTDLLTNGVQSFLVRNGSEWMSRISGSGCISTAVLACFFRMEQGLEAVLRGSVYIRTCAYLAELSMKEKGTACFKLKLLDRISSLEENRDTIVTVIDLKKKEGNES